jgi:hypothetical protein
LATNIDQIDKNPRIQDCMNPSTDLDILDSLGNFAESISGELKAVSARLVQFKNLVKTQEKKLETHQRNTIRAQEISEQNYKVLLEKYKALEKNLEKYKALEKNSKKYKAPEKNSGKTTETEIKRKREGEEEEIKEMEEMDARTRVRGLIDRQEGLINDARERECMECRKATMNTRPGESIAHKISDLRVVASRKQGLLEQMQVDDCTLLILLTLVRLLIHYLCRRSTRNAKNAEYLGRTS